MLSTENMAHHVPFVQATIPLQKRMAKQALAFGLATYRMKAGTSILSVSKLLPHLSQMFGIRHYLCPWVNQQRFQDLCEPCPLSSCLKSKH